MANGASSLLLEGTATEVAEIITKRVDVPVMSCGSGVGCDGQILVAPDILGQLAGKKPKFVKSYTDLGDVTINAVNEYAKEVTEGKFPDDEHSYHMKPGQLQSLTAMLENKR